MTNLLESSISIYVKKYNALNKIAVELKLYVIKYSNKNIHQQSNKVNVTPLKYINFSNKNATYVSTNMENTDKPIRYQIDDKTVNYIFYYDKFLKGSHFKAQENIVS